MSTPRKPQDRKPPQARKPVVPKRPKRRVRLLEVRIQPVLVYDDGTTMEPVLYGESRDHPIITVPSSGWPGYPAEFARQLVEWQKRLDAEA